MGSRASRQFNELQNGIRNGTNTGSVPKSMREGYEDSQTNNQLMNSGMRKNTWGPSEDLKTTLTDTKEANREVANYSSPSREVNFTGSFIVELYPIARDEIKYPSDVTLEGDILTVPNGSITNGMGGFSINSAKKGFFAGAGYKHVKNIKDDKGNILRENRKEKIDSNKYNPQESLKTAKLKSIDYTGFSLPD